MIKPIRNGSDVLVHKFNLWFELASILQINREIFRRAAHLRATFAGLKTPEAIHRATSLHHECDEFWTNDARLDRIAPTMVKNIFA